MATKKHSKKEIREVIKYAIQNGWALEWPQSKSGHTFAWLVCSEEGSRCKIRIDGTPSNPSKKANEIRKWIDTKCPHKEEEEQE